MAISQTIVVIGASGQLGGAIIRSWLRNGCVVPEQLWISIRSGKSCGLDQWNAITFTTSSAAPFQPVFAR